ncbi:MAG: type II toxin-antitoxin system Phd/YefM family antitoxin [Schumannella sp.]|nr:type II toxin-antitoxin system Phd/YefM family antitoxin [Microbacteriaceae bacterium]
MTTLPVADARASFSRIVDSASTTHERFEITRNGARVAVLLGADDYDGLMETLEILSDPELMAQLREAEADRAAGRVYPLEDIVSELRAAGKQV